jgi:hypothetical protein
MSLLQYIALLAALLYLFCLLWRLLPRNIISPIATVQERGGVLQVKGKKKEGGTFLRGTGMWVSTSDNHDSIKALNPLKFPSNVIHKQYFAQVDNCIHLDFDFKDQHNITFIQV